MNGNMTSGAGRTIDWTWFNMPSVIRMGGVSSAFDYDADHNRIRQRASNGTTTTYINSLMEKVDDGTYWTYKHYISAPVGRIAVYTTKTKQSDGSSAAAPDLKYLHHDHIGSVDVITNESGSVLERDSFDAWGYRRTTNNWQTPLPIPGPVPSNLRSIVSRGFTGHEELDDLGLVHMNGRIYDPGIGRFLSADPFVQAPMVTQNFNRYSYVLNNPLSFTDPSGFNFLNDFGNWLNDVFGSTGARIITAVIAVVTYAVLNAVLTPVVGNIVAAFAAGFTSAFISTSLSGASLGQAFQAGLISGGIAAVTVGALDYLKYLKESAGAVNAGSTVADVGTAVEQKTGSTITLNTSYLQQLGAGDGTRVALMTASKLQQWAEAQGLPEGSVVVWADDVGHELGISFFKQVGSAIAQVAPTIASIATHDPYITGYQGFGVTGIRGKGWQATFGQYMAPEGQGFYFQVTPGIGNDQSVFYTAGYSEGGLKEFTSPASMTINGGLGKMGGGVQFDRLGPPAGYNVTLGRSLSVATGSVTFAPMTFYTPPVPYPHYDLMLQNPQYLQFFPGGY
jgi:RHS repeat-associated protein